MRIIIIICAAFLYTANSVASDRPVFEEKSRVMAESEKSMAIWIDVRTPEEFAKGHVAGSINIPHEIIGSEISAITRDVDSDIRVYCRSGNRSGIAQNTLKGLGYANVVNEGGYEDIVQRKASGEAIP